MSKGLERMLLKIKETPTPTLIARYLSLVAELPNEDEKISHALDLAAGLIETKPSESLRVAHMVQKMEPNNLRAYDVLISALEVRGRHAKAEVLRVERDRIEHRLQAGPDADEISTDPAAGVISSYEPQTDEGGERREGGDGEPVLAPTEYAGPESSLETHPPTFSLEGSVSKVLPVEEQDQFRPTDWLPPTNEPGIMGLASLSLAKSYEEDPDPPPPPPAEAPASAPAVLERLERPQLQQADLSSQRTLPLDPALAELAAMDTSPERPAAFGDEVLSVLGRSPFAKLDPVAEAKAQEVRMAEAKLALAKAEEEAKAAEAKAAEAKAAEEQAAAAKAEAENAAAAKAAAPKTPDSSREPAWKTPDLGEPDGQFALANATKLPSPEQRTDLPMRRSIPQGEFHPPVQRQPSVVPEVVPPLQAQAVAAAGSVVQAGQQIQVQIQLQQAPRPKPKLRTRAIPRQQNRLQNLVEAFLRERPVAETNPPAEARRPDPRSSQAPNGFHQKGTSTNSQPYAPSHETGTNTDALRRANMKSSSAGTHDQARRRNPGPAGTLTSPPSQERRKDGEAAKGTLLRPPTAAQHSKPAPDARARSRDLTKPEPRGIPTLDLGPELAPESAPLTRELPRRPSEFSHTALRSAASDPEPASTVVLEPASVLAGDEFWHPIRAQLGSLASAVPLASHGAERKRREHDWATRNGASKPVEPALLRALKRSYEEAHAVNPEAALAQLWDELQALWGDKPEGVCADLLVDLELQHATPGFWGFYLDSLLARGAGRKVLVEARLLLADKRQLVWAHVAWRRLPLAWQALGMRGFLWREEEGIDTLLTNLAQRPQLTLRSLVLVR